MRVNLRINENKEFSDEDYANIEYVALVNGNTCFTSDKYAKRPTGNFDGYAGTYWKVNPNKPTFFYVQQLIKFHNSLKEGDFEKRYDKLHEVYVRSAGMKKKCKMLPLDISDTNVPSLEERLPLDIESFIVRSPFGDFGMHIEGASPISKPAENWSPKNGCIGVVNHQDISSPLTELLFSTAHYPIDPKLLTPILKMIYTFT